MALFGLGTEFTEIHIPLQTMKGSVISKELLFLARR